MDGRMDVSTSRARTQASDEPDLLRFFGGLFFSVMGMYLRMYGKRRLTLLAGGCGNG